MLHPQSWITKYITKHPIYYYQSSKVITTLLCNFLFPCCIRQRCHLNLVVVLLHITWFNHLTIPLQSGYHFPIFNQSPTFSLTFSIQILLLSSCFSSFLPQTVITNSSSCGSMWKQSLVTAYSAQSRDKGQEKTA